MNDVTHMYDVTFKTQFDMTSLTVALRFFSKSS